MELHFQMFSVQTKTKTRRFQIPPTGSKSVFEKLRFRDRLEWKEGLSSFQIPPHVMWTSPKTALNVVIVVYSFQKERPVRV